MPGRRRGLFARICLTAAALLPYWRFLTFSAVFVTDDYFASDIFNGEFPGRVLLGGIVRHGEWPAWTTQLCSGLPLAGAPADPVGLLAFALLPPAAALDLFVVTLLLVAAHGAYGLAQRFGADRAGALLAGLAFAGCGYFAAQLKHLSIVSTVAWLPAGLLLLDRVFAPRAGEATPARRALRLALFGLVFAEQVLCGFPQSAYICALVYGAFALIRAIEHRRAAEGRASWLVWLAAASLAIALGAAGGAIVMLPLAKLGAVSDRAEALGWDWATRLAYTPGNAWMFLFPYASGDISNNTYTGPPFFWEDFGYLGVLPFLLAIYGAVREWRRSTTKLVTLLTVFAYAFVLGRAAPIFRLAYLLIPGISMFRFPTRFLIVVELGLALLAATGLTRLRADAQRRWPRPSPMPDRLALAVVALTVLDLTVHQPRQNPVVPSAAWLAPPASVNLVKADTAQPRTFTPRHRDIHRQVFQRARGWADVEPYFEARDLLEPNLGGGLWNVPSSDCYAGISARWYVDVWGDHNREASLAALLAAPDFRAQELRVHPRLPNLLRTYGVTHLLSPFPQRGSVLTFEGRAGSAYVYRIEDAARFRFVARAHVVTDDKAAVAELLAETFDPNSVILLHDAPPELGAVGAPVRVGTAAISLVHEDQRLLALDVTAPADGFLLVADTYYPGWTATIDGRVTPLYRANISVRGLQMPAGSHAVQLRYHPPGLALGAWISVSALGLLVAWALAAHGCSRRRRRDRPIAPQKPITT
jgi:hypothetical protein